MDPLPPPRSHPSPHPRSRRPWRHPLAPPLSVEALVFACELPCIHCAYDLRTIPLRALCPECGKPAADSLRSLALVEPADLSRIRFGLILLIVAGLGIPLLALAIILLTIFGGGAGGEESVAVLIGALLFAAGPIIARIAIAKIAPPLRTQFIRALPPEPPAPASAPLHFERALRIVSTTHLLLCLAFGASIIILTRSFGSSEHSAFIAATLGAFALLAWDARNLLLCRGFSEFCARANLPGTRRLFNFLFGAAITLATAHALAGTVALILYLFPKLLDDFFRTNMTNGSLSPGYQFAYLLLGIATSIIQFASLGWGIAWPIMLALLSRRLARPLTLAQAAQREILAEPAATETT